MLHRHRWIFKAAKSLICISNYKGYCVTTERCFPVIFYFMDLKYDQFWTFDWIGHGKVNWTTLHTLIHSFTHSHSPTESDRSVFNRQRHKTVFVKIWKCLVGFLLCMVWGFQNCFEKISKAILKWCELLFTPLSPLL